MRSEKATRMPMATERVRQDERTHAPVEMRMYSPGSGRNGGRLVTVYQRLVRQKSRSLPISILVPILAPEDYIRTCNAACRAIRIQELPLRLEINVCSLDLLTDIHSEKR
jgi:hypothetical protein